MEEDALHSPDAFSCTMFNSNGLDCIGHIQNINNNNDRNKIFVKCFTSGNTVSVTDIHQIAILNERAILVKD